MKKKILLSSVGAMMLLTQGYADTKYESYNYIGFGVESLSYVENPIKNGIQYKTSVEVNSPVYTSGSLINAGDHFDFSIDAASTLTPTQGDEQVQNTDTSYVVQENKFDAMVSDLKILVHYKVNNNHRLVFGPSYEMFSMKRHSFSIPNIELNQETIATLNGTVGYWYENAPFSNGGMRFKTSVLYGVPMWRDATNTSSEELSFNSTNGYFANWSGYVGFEMTKGLELGFFGEYTFTKKEGDDETINLDGKTVTWPDNELETFRYGLNLVWNFSVK